MSLNLLRKSAWFKALLILYLKFYMRTLNPIRNYVKHKLLKRNGICRIYFICCAKFKLLVINSLFNYTINYFKFIFYTFCFIIAVIYFGPTQLTQTQKTPRYHFAYLISCKLRRIFMLVRVLPPTPAPKNIYSTNC